MARTYRNRHSVPTGYLVRDGGFVHRKGGAYPTRLSRRKFWRTPITMAPYVPRENPDEDWPIFRSKWMRKERKAYRKAHYRQYKAKVKDRMRHEDWENLPRYRRTSGWLTW